MVVYCDPLYIGGESPKLSKKSVTQVMDSPLHVKHFGKFTKL